MPRKTPLPISEMAICKRLKLYRESTRLPRRLFARQAGVDTSTLVRVELGRAPLKYVDAARITNAFALNPKWLAIGEGAIALGVSLPGAELLGIDARADFSAIFASHLEEQVDRRIAALEEVKSKYGYSEHPTDAKGRVYAEEILKLDLHEWLSAVPNRIFNDLINRIRLAAMPLVYDWDAEHDDPERIASRKKLMEIERARLHKRREELKSQKKHLTAACSLVTSTPMSTEREPLSLKSLLADVRRLTKAPGKKSELAESLHIPLASVSRWLSGKREPGGHATFQLFNWVEQQKRHQK